MKRGGTSLFIATCASGLLLTGGLAMAQQMPAGEEASGMSAQDAKLEKKIDSRLQRDQRLKAHNLDASVSDGIVTLTGTVSTSAEKARAARLARTKGVNDVDNQIQIEGQEAAQPGATMPPPQGAGEPGTAVPGEQQPAPSPEGKVRERTTRVEERTETRTERQPQQPQEQQQQQQQQEGTPSSTPSDQNIRRPAPPAEPGAPAPSPSVPEP